MSEEVIADAQVNDSVRSTLQVGALYHYENAIIVSEVTRADLENGLALKVNKAGDSMTGDLELEDGLAVKFDGEIDYIVKSRDDAHQLILQDGNGKGIFVNGMDNEQPYYTDGTNSYRILNANDITNGSTDYLRTWGNMIGTISNQTDLTQYILSVVGGAGMLGRPNYSAGVSLPLIQSSGGLNPTHTALSHTMPGNGFVFVSGTGNSSSPAMMYINGVLINGASADTFIFPVSAGDVISGYTQSPGGGMVYYGSLTAVYFPQR